MSDKNNFNKYVMKNFKLLEISKVAQKNILGGNGCLEFMTAKVVEKATSGLKDTLKTQV
jgi:uncharacterized protein YjfI (DUF2170 family)